MKLSVKNISVLILILINSGLPLPLTSKNYTKLLLEPKLFLMDKDRTNPDEKIDEKSNVRVDTATGSGDRLLMSIIQHRRPRARQIMEQFSQKNLPNNLHDDSNMQRILWQQFNRKNFGSKFSPFSSTSVQQSQANTLQSQETAQIDPIYAVKKITSKTDDEKLNPNNYDDSTEIVPTFGSLFVDLLHDPQSNSNADSFYSLPKISQPLFSTYLTALSSSFNRITYSEKDCSLIVRTMPVLLINTFMNSLIAIGKLPKFNILMIPFVVSSLMNFIISFFIIDEHCPAGSV